MQKDEPKKKSSTPTRSPSSLLHHEQRPVADRRRILNQWQEIICRRKKVAAANDLRALSLLACNTFLMLLWRGILSLAHERMEYIAEPEPSHGWHVPKGKSIVQLNLKIVELCRQTGGINTLLEAVSSCISLFGGTLVHRVTGLRDLLVGSRVEGQRTQCYCEVWSMLMYALCSCYWYRVSWS